MDLLDDIRLDDLEQNQREIAEIVGIDAYKELVKFYGGSDIYIQKSITITKRIRDKKVMDMYGQGVSIHEICSSFNLSESTVRRIIRDCIVYRGYTHKNQMSFI